MQKPNGVKATFDRGDHKVEIEVQILIFDEDNIHYVYSPALDLTGYGNTEEEAKDSFYTMLTEFVNYTENKKTVYIELERLGWTVNSKKKRVNPPKTEQLLEDNETYRDLVNLPNVQSSSTKFGLALS